MTYDVTDKERFLRAELAAQREARRNMPVVISRAPTFKNGVKNGGFDTNSDWVTNLGSTISGGTLNVGDFTGTNEIIRNVPDKTVRHDVHQKVNFTISESTANFGVRVTATPMSGASEKVNNDYYQTDGPHSVILPAGFFSEPFVLAFQRIASHTGTLKVDDVHMWEVDPADGVPWLRLPRGQRVGTQGRIYRDGSPLMVSDYEELRIAEQYFIKPLVAPGVNTEFDVYCGIGA